MAYPGGWLEWQTHELGYRFFPNSVYLLTKDVSDAVKNIQSTLDYVRKQRNDGSGSTEASNVTTWTATINTDLANLLSAKTTIVSTTESVKKKNADLVKLKTGPRRTAEMNTNEMTF
jgi:hypothetical protein